MSESLKYKSLQGVYWMIYCVGFVYVTYFLQEKGISASRLVPLSLYAVSSPLFCNRGLAAWLIEAAHSTEIYSNRLNRVKSLNLRRNALYRRRHRCHNSLCKFHDSYQLYDAAGERRLLLLPQKKYRHRFWFRSCLRFNRFRRHICSRRQAHCYVWGSRSCRKRYRSEYFSSAYNSFHALLRRYD